jgi:HEAT repeat protein
LDTWRQREREKFLLALAQHEGAKLPVRSPAALMKMLEDKDPDRRHIAAAQLGMIKPPTADVIDALVRCLGDDAMEVRLAALESLGTTDAGKKAVSQVWPMLGDASPVVRCAAAEYLGKATGGGDAVNGALVRALKDADPDVRAVAAKSLGLRGAAAAAVEPLLGLLKADPSWLVRQEAAAALTEVCSTDEKVQVGVMMAMLSDPMPEVQSAAAMAIVRGGFIHHMTPAQLARLAETREECRALLVEAMGEGKPDAQRIKMLTDYLCDESTAVRAAAARAIVRGGLVQSLTPEQLATLAATADDDCRVLLIEALGNGKPDAQQIKTVTDYLRDKSHSVRVAAARALGRIGPSAAPAVEPLMKMVQGGRAHSEELCEEITALGRIGPPAARAAGLLSRLLNGLEWLRQKPQEAIAKQELWMKKTASEYHPAGDANANDDDIVFMPPGVLGTDDDRVGARLRVRLVEAIVALDANAGASALVTALGDPNCQAADLAEKGLAKCTLKSPAAMKEAMAALSWLPDGRRAPVVDLLVRCGAPVAAAAVRQVLSGGDPATLVPLAERLDPNAMAPALEVLRGADLLAAIDAAHVLSYSRRFGKPAALILADQLGTGGLGARGQAREDLIRLGPQAVDALLILSRGSIVMARMLAMQTLGGIGQAGGKDAENGLILGLKDSDAGVRRAAAVALVAVSKDPSPAAAVLAEDLKSAIPQLRLEAVENLGRIGPAAGADVARALARCLRDEHWAVRLAAARALERIAASAAPVEAVAEALKAATRDSDSDVRGAAEAALAAIEKARK